MDLIETGAVDELRALQLTRLRDVVRRAHDRIPHYRKRFAAAGVHDLHHLGDIARFPLTAPRSRSRG